MDGQFDKRREQLLPALGDAGSGAVRVVDRLQCGGVRLELQQPPSAAEPRERSGRDAADAAGWSQESRSLRVRESEVVDIYPADTAR